MSGATEETHENVVTARFVRGTVWPRRLVIIAVNVEGKGRANQDTNPFPSDGDKLLHLFCACARIEMTSWGDVTSERPRPRLPGRDADRNLSDQRRLSFVKKEVIGFNKPAPLRTVPSASTFRRFVFCPNSVFGCFVQFSQVTGTNSLIGWLV